MIVPSWNHGRSLRIRRRVPIPLDGMATDAEFITFDGITDAKEHFAIRIAGTGMAPVPLVRIHSECMTGDVFGSRRCDCGPQLRHALNRMDVEGGVLVYLRQEGRGIGLVAKIDAYALQLAGHDTFAANRLLGHNDDERDFRIAGSMLTAMGVNRIRLLTNNLSKRDDLVASGIAVDEVVHTPVFRTPENTAYLAAKRDLKGHVLVGLHDHAASESREPAEIGDDERGT